MTTQYINNSSLLTIFHFSFYFCLKCSFPRCSFKNMSCELSLSEMIHEKNDISACFKARSEAWQGVCLREMNALTS